MLLAAALSTKVTLTKVRVQINSDLPGLLDEWATSLFRELDYTREARNGIRFRDLYRHLKVRLFFSRHGGESQLDVGHQSRLQG